MVSLFSFLQARMAEFAIANLYVDEVNEGKLVEEAIVKMLEQLDPHSTYSDPEEVKRMASHLCQTATILLQS